MTPPWLPLAPEVPNRDDAIVTALRGLDQSVAVGIVGPPGSGKTTLAGAVAARSRRPVVAVSFAGCEEGADALRALGEAVGARPIGDELSISERLRGVARALVVADDVAAPEVAEAVLRVVEGAAGASLIVVSEGTLLPESVPLDGLSPDPRLDAAMPLAPAAGVLAAFPMGLPGDERALPAFVLRPDLRDRAVLRRAVAVRLSPPGDAAEQALARLGGVLPLARGAHMDDASDVRDALLLRALARTLAGRTEGAMCAAAAARLIAVAGQLDAARQLLRAQRGETEEAAAILLWADGDVLLMGGDVDDALQRFGEAAALFHRAGAADLHASLLRRTADRLATRGEVVAAEEAYRQARAIYRSQANAEGVAATLRGAADLSVGSGEWVSAGTLHEQITATVDLRQSLEWANLRLAEASLAIARGEYARAEVILVTLATAFPSEPLLRANVARRRADLLLRRGSHDAALGAADQAATLYAQVGEGPAHAAAVRLGADIAAAGGRPAEARNRYRTAMLLQVRLRLLPGLVRTLAHAAHLEESLGNPDAARRLREQRAATLGVR